VITVDATGPLALVQDLGRPGCASVGVSPSGAADRCGLRLANRLVGNPEEEAAIEVTFGGLEVSVDALTWVAVAGAPTQLRVDGVPTASHTSIALRPGSRLRVEPPVRGLRSYLAVRGGLDVPATLGSRSTDVLSGLGPPPLRAGQRLAVGRPRQPLPDADQAPCGPPTTTLTVLPGPRRDWFTDAAWAALVEGSWTVTNDSNRVAVRLEGPLLERLRDDELPSEGLLRGAIQVPASGQPLIFLSDHPVTGGYPVIGVLNGSSCDDAGQLRPGDVVRLRPPARGR
jgi:biotin-dependent carboxylase-like uncharacterized protein